MAQPPGARNRDSGTRWMLACGVGCGAFLLLGVLAVVGGYSALQYGLNEAATEFRAELERIYTELLEEEQIPAEHAEVFDRIYQVAQSEEASFWTTMVALIVISAYADDGEITDEEAESAATLADVLESDPDMSLIEFGQFVERNPEFEGAFNDAQRAFEGYESGSDWSESVEEESTPEGVVESPEAAEAAEVTDVTEEL